MSPLSSDYASSSKPQWLRLNKSTETCRGDDFTSLLKGKMPHHLEDWPTTATIPRD